MPLLLLSTICGLLTATYSPPLPLPLLWPTLLTLAWLLLRKSPLSPIIMAACCALLAAGQYHQQLHPGLPAHHVARISRDLPASIEGRILAFHPGDNTLRIDLEADRLLNDAVIRPLTGRLRLTVGEDVPGLRVGQRIRFRSRLRSPVPFGTPGEFDYRRYLAARDIYVTAYLKRADALVPFTAEEENSLLTRLAAIRRTIGHHIDAAVPAEQAPLVRALVIGERKFSVTRRQLLAEAGLSHLFAISGLHLGLAALLLYTLGRWFYRRSETLMLLAPPGRLLPIMLLPLLWGYLQLTGNALSTQRAFFMAACGALLLFCGRRTRPLQALATVALAMLCSNPLIFFEPAWQLSMAGVGGILLALPGWQQHIARLPGLWRWPATLTGTTLAATFATTPLVLSHFHLLAPAGLLNNLLAVPLIGFGAVPLGLSGAIFSPLWPTAAAALFRLCGQVCHLTLQGASYLSDWPPLKARVFYLPPHTLIGVACLALALLIPLPLRRWHRWPLLIIAGMLILWVPAAPQALTVTALSVGQGEALLLSKPQTGHYLIDGGGLYGSTFDVGSRLVAPALARLGVRSLEAVILTHAHPDHYLGLAEILEQVPVKAFWSALPLDDLPPVLRMPLQRHAIPVRTFPAGWSELEREPDRGLAVYVPSQQAVEINDRSLVLYLRHGRDGVLFTGDLERAGVQDLLAHPPAGAVTLLKLPHHGSRHSEPWRLVHRFQPQQVFASSGRRNSYGLPHQKVTDALAARGLTCYDTGRHSTLRFSSTGSGWQLQQWQRGLFR